MKPAAVLAWVGALALAVLAVVLALPLLVVPDQPAPGADLAPLFLGGRALWEGLDPADRQVHAQLWENFAGRGRVDTFFMPYPCTAAMLAMPLSYIGWEGLLRPVWLGSVGALALAGASAGLLGGRERASAAAVAAGLGVVGVLSMDVVHHSLELGQVNPLMVLLLVAAAVCLVKDWQVAAGLLIAVGAGLKGLPFVLLLPALAARRWRAVGAAVVGSLLIAGATLYWFPAWSPLADLGRAIEQATVGQATEHPPLGGLWSLRTPVLGAATVGLSLWLGWRRRDALAMHALVLLALALVAVQTGGMLPPHEMLLIAPAMVLATGLLAHRGWGLWAVAAAIPALWTLSPLEFYPQLDGFSQDHALLPILLLWAVAAAWTVALAWRPVRD